MNQIQQPDSPAGNTSTTQGKAPTSKGSSPFRPASSHRSTFGHLGPLEALPGFWEGSGFNLIARPDFSGKNPHGFFLQLNLIRESIEFTPIGSPVVNRGSQQKDISLYGLTYLQRVTDSQTGGALHIEPGLWLNIPATSKPKAQASLARLATIPHGNAVCAVGHAEYVEVNGLPDIPPANTIPFPIGSTPPPAGSPNRFLEYDLRQPSPFRSSPLPPELHQALVDDPNTLLRQALEGTHPTRITRLITSTPPEGGVSNIPFIQKNADAPAVESVFAIEVMQAPSGEEYLQLQYSQTVLLNFGGLSWPHVTVATLIKAF